MGRYSNAAQIKRTACSTNPCRHAAIAAEAVTTGMPAFGVGDEGATG